MRVLFKLVFLHELDRISRNVIFFNYLFFYLNHYVDVSKFLILFSYLIICHTVKVLLLNCNDKNLIIVLNKCHISKKRMIYLSSLSCSLVQFDEKSIARQTTLTNFSKRFLAGSLVCFRHRLFRRITRPFAPGTRSGLSLSGCLIFSFELT